jgi:hypothetical protein
MSRSERYIPPSDEELQRLRELEEFAKQCDQQREELLRTALKKLKKADLVEVTLRVAQEGKPCEWKLEQEVLLDKPVILLAHDIEVAIDIATKVDERRLNYNFEYDWRAYEAVRRGLSQLIQKDGIEEAKALAVKLIEKGSYQIDCSDEGLMQDEIENCLRPVIAAVAGTSSGREWALKMLRHDSSGFLCEQELNELACKGQKPTAETRGANPGS